MLLHEQKFLVDMKRNITQQLQAWKEKTNRKPLIVNGARQVGKTYSLKDFGKKAYENVAYINCDGNEEVANIFAQDYDMHRILLHLSALTGVDIKPERTLIIIDEIQECPKALNSLKYFCENAPQYHVAVAGSLLGISLHAGSSFPVGKVDMIKMYPMTFDEFLMAAGEDRLVDMLRQQDYSLITPMSARLLEMLRQYYYVGGMPAVVKAFFASHQLSEVRDIQNQILFDYQRDFSKHAPLSEVPRINMVWNSIPSQLAKENKKFVYGALKKGARATQFEMAIEWLIDAGLIYKVPRVSEPRKPLKFYEDLNVFKLFSLDVGLMGAMAETTAADVLVRGTAMTEYRGAFTELFVLTQLVARGITPYYYSANDSRIEIDFLIQKAGTVIPLEVKAEENVHSKSLRTYIEKYPQLKGVRLSMLPYHDQDWMTNYPLYCVNFI